MRKIVFTGPECTGKTTLVDKLATELQLPYVPEVARGYIDQLQRAYAYDDLLNIAMLQMSEEERVKSLQPHLLICDTDLLTVKIWLDDKFKSTESWLTHAFVDRTPDMYFLCAPDFPWEPDAQREDPHRREYLHKIYRDHMLHYKLRFIELNGSIEKRLYTVYNYINQPLQQLF